MQGIIIGETQYRMSCQLLKKLRFKYSWPHLVLDNYLKNYVRQILEYGEVIHAGIYDNCSIDDSNKIENVQLEAVRVVTGAKLCTSSPINIIWMADA